MCYGWCPSPPGSYGAPDSCSYIIKPSSTNNRADFVYVTWRNNVVAHLVWTHIRVDERRELTQGSKVTRPGVFHQVMQHTTRRNITRHHYAIVRAAEKPEDRRLGWLLPRWRGDFLDAGGEILRLAGLPAA